MSDDLEISLILASSSPRRRDLMALTGWPLKTLQVEVPEERALREHPRQMAERLALSKAGAARAIAKTDGILLTADTLVVDGDDVLGKPRDLDHARELLNRLNGNSHQVITAVFMQDLAGGWNQLEVCETIVPMRDYSQEELETYLSSQSPLDKAGAYGIQDQPFNPVMTSTLDGCYANVMGLPLCHVARGVHSKTEAPVGHIPEACMLYTGYTCPVYEDVLKGRM